MNLLSRLTIAWAVLFAIVHFYWAAGGSAGMNGEPAEELGAQLYIGVIALVGLASGVIAYGLSRDPGRRLLVRLARLGGAALLLGVAVGTARWIADARTWRRRSRRRGHDALLPRRRRAVPDAEPDGPGE